MSDHLPESFSLASILAEKCVCHQEGLWVKMVGQDQTQVSCIAGKFLTEPPGIVGKWKFIAKEQGGISVDGKLLREKKNQRSGDFWQKINCDTPRALMSVASVCFSVLCLIIN